MRGTCIKIKNTKGLYLCLDVVVNYLRHFSEYRQVLYRLQANCLKSQLQA